MKILIFSFLIFNSLYFEKLTSIKVSILYLIHIFNLQLWILWTTYMVFSEIKLSSLLCFIEISCSAYYTYKVWIHWLMATCIYVMFIVIIWSLVQTLSYLKSDLSVVNVICYDISLFSCCMLYLNTYNSSWLLCWNLRLI